MSEQDEPPEPYPVPQIKPGKTSEQRDEGTTGAPAMSSRLFPVPNTQAELHGLALVRCREGILPTGQPITAEPALSTSARPVHIIRTYNITDDPKKRDNQNPKTLQEITNLTPWQTCCGTVFAPGAAEPVEWGGDFVAHERCVAATGETPSFVERILRESRDGKLRYSEAFSQQEWDTSTAALNTIFAKRDRDWIFDGERDIWTYEASFNGAFPGDRLNPRDIDLGLERLTVELPFPGTVYVHSCGVRDGCPKHRARTTRFQLADIKALNESISEHEEAATSIDLHKLAWCLIRESCSKTPVYWD